MVLNLVFSIIVREINFHLEIVIEKEADNHYLHIIEVNPSYSFNENDETVYTKIKLFYIVKRY